MNAGAEVHSRQRVARQHFDVSNSLVVRPQIKAEYFLHHKFSVRTQLSYTYTDPDVIVQDRRPEPHPG